MIDYSMRDINIIAELACIHEGNNEYIYELAMHCKNNGANSIKFQCIDPDGVVSKDHPDYDYFNTISFSKSQWKEIIKNVFKIGLKIYIDISGDFSLSIADENKEFVKGVKLNTSENNNHKAIDYLKSSKFEILFACSGLNLVEIISVLEILKDNKVTLMHGFQSFPTNTNLDGGPPLNPIKSSELDFWKISMLRESFPDFNIGLSDHLEGGTSLSTDLPIYAFFMGANTFEKHVTIARSEKREDYFSSIEPSELFVMSNKLNEAMAIMGMNKFKFSLLEKEYIKEMKKSLLANKTIHGKEKVSIANTNYIRTGDFSSTLSLLKFDNKTVKREIKSEALIKADDLDLNFGIFCNVRLSSSRLKNKGLLSFYKNYNTTEYLLNRLNSYTPNLGQIVLATTLNTIDDQLESIAERMNVNFFRGADLDVMQRMISCAELYKWDYFARITGDDQFISCEYLEKAKKEHLFSNNEFTTISGLPAGMECEIIDVAALKKIHKYIINKDKTEYITWFLESDYVCKNGSINADAKHNHSEFRLTLDYEEDYKLMSLVAKNLHNKYGDVYLTTDQIIDELKLIGPQSELSENLTNLKRSDIDTKIKFNI